MESELIRFVLSDPQIIFVSALFQSVQSVLHVQRFYVHAVSVSQYIKKLFHFIKISRRNVVETSKEQSHTKLQINNYMERSVLLKCLKVLLDTDNENNFIGLIK